MDIEKNKAVVQAFDELGNGGGDLSALDELCTLDAATPATTSNDAKRKARPRAKPSGVSSATSPAKSSTRCLETSKLDGRSITSGRWRYAPCLLLRGVVKVGTLIMFLAVVVAAMASQAWRVRHSGVHVNYQAVSAGRRCALANRRPA